MRYNADRTRSFGPKNFPARVVLALMRRVDSRVLAKLLPSGKERLDPALRRRLVALYQDDIRRLETMLDRDLSAWKR